MLVTTSHQVKMEWIVKLIFTKTPALTSARARTRAQINVHIYFRLSLLETQIYLVFEASLMANNFSFFQISFNYSNQK